MSLCQYMILLWSALQYVVVKFLPLNNTEEETVAVAPSLWINYDLNMCKWSPKKYQSDKVNRWVMSLTEPKHDFIDIPIQILYEYGEYSFYNNAIAK